MRRRWRGRELAELYRALAAEHSETFRPNLAMTLSSLANRLRTVGEHEAALATAQEAVELDRPLAAQRPDAFRPNLAWALFSLALELDALGRPEEALQENHAAIRELADPFLLHPAALVQQMGPMVRTYLASCEKLGRPRDEALLAPVAAAFATLRVPKGGS